MTPPVTETERQAGQGPGSAVPRAAPWPEPGTDGDAGPNPHTPSAMLLGANLVALERSLHYVRLSGAIEYARLHGQRWSSAALRTVSASSPPARPTSTSARPSA